MKSKLSTKVLGIVVTVATLASLLVGLTAAPAGVSAATNQMVFTPLSLPSNSGNFLGGQSSAPAAGTTSTTFTPITNPHLDGITASADGVTIYAFDFTNKVLYESLNSGKSWGTAVGIGVTGAFVGLHISPNFATDGQVFLATSNQVWVISGGVTNVALLSPLSLATELGSGAITSMDVAPWYTNGVMTVLVGITGGIGNSNVLNFQLSNFNAAWAEVGNMTGMVTSVAVTTGATFGTPPAVTFTAAPTGGTTATGIGILNGSGLMTGVAITNPGKGYLVAPTPTTPGVTFGAVTIGMPNVLYAKYSQNFQADVEIMAVYTAAGSTFLDANVGNQGWNTSTYPAVAIATPVNNPIVGTPPTAFIAVGTDYFAGSGSMVMVGTTGLTNNGVFAVKNWGGGLAGTVSAMLGANSTNGNIPVSIIAVSGPIATGSVLVASPGTTTLNITTGATASTVTWAPGASYRSATGLQFTGLWYAGTNNATLYASTTQTNGNDAFVNQNVFTGSAVQVSADNGNTFNQIGIIDVGLGNPNLSAYPLFTQISYGSPTMVSDTNWLLRIGNFGYFQSKDKGVSWVRIFCNIWNGSNVQSMSRSQNYATNNTFILGNNTNIALITTNGGSSYTPISLATASSGGLSMIENDAYYYYNNGIPAAFYVTTRPYVNATFPSGMGAINSLTRSGADKTLMTYAIGTNNGMVMQSVDAGVTFGNVGTSPFASTDKVAVTYTSDGTLWAYANGNTSGSANYLPTSGIFRWITATSTWQNINFPANTPVNNISVTSDGTMYATGDYLINTAPSATPANVPVYGSASDIGNGIYRCLNYAASKADGTSAADWGTTSTSASGTNTGINGRTFPGGSATATLGTSATGYPGGTPIAYTLTAGTVSPNASNAGFSVTSISVAGAATGNTIYIADKSTTVAGSNIPFCAVYSFVDTFITGPTVIAPKDASVLTTDTSAAMSWNAMNGPAGGSAATNTSYLVYLSTSKDFSGFTTPVMTHVSDAMTNSLGLTLPGGLDPYSEGNTTQTANQNGGTALKSGTVYYWQVAAISPIPSRTTVASFTTALTPVTNQVGVNAFPSNGATGVDVNTTFTWPPVSGTNVTYEFVIAEETGQTDKFAIIDYSATTPTNATPLRETLKYNTQYWWRVRATNGTVTSGWSTFFFTTEAAPAATTTGGGTTITIPPVTSTVITITQPQTTFTISQPATNNNSIPPALLWAVIAIGAILIIAVIVLIVRTRRIP
jgi:hypothetical protein